jgi:hypothetical protein
VSNDDERELDGLRTYLRHPTPHMLEDARALCRVEGASWVAPSAMWFRKVWLVMVDRMYEEIRNEA